MPCCSYAFPSKLFSFKIKQIREHEQLSAHLSANSIGKGEGKIETEPNQANQAAASSASQLMKIPGGIDGRNLASAPSPLPSIPFPPQETLQTRRSGEGKRKIEIGRGRTLEKESHGGLERGKQLQLAEFANRLKRLNLGNFINVIVGISSYLANP